MSNLKEYVKTLKYMVIDEKKIVSFYQSLRKIASDIQVDSSTISKNLKQTGVAYCTSKHTMNTHYIKRLF